MTIRLFLYTEPPTRSILSELRLENTLFASDEVTPEDRQAYGTCVQLPPVTKLQETLRILESLEFDQLVIQTEYGLAPGAILARRRGLPGPPLEAAFACLNKWVCRKILHRCGLPVPRFALISRANEVLEFSSHYPVVLKPVASTLGRGVVLVRSASEVEPRVSELLSFLPRAPDILRLIEFAREAHFDLECDPTRQFMVEEFVEGDPLEVDGLIFEDRVLTFPALGQTLSPPPWFFIEGYSIPLDRPQVQAIARAAVQAVGLKEGGFCIEFRRETIIEVNGRLGEDDGLPQLFRAAIGKAPIQKWIERDETAPFVHTPWALAYRNGYLDGTVRTVPQHEGAEIVVWPGKKLYAPPHPETAPHLAYALATAFSTEDAYQNARRIVDSLSFDIS